MTTTSDKPAPSGGRKPKGLKKAQTFHQHFKNSAKYLHGWNNTTNSGVRFIKAISIFTVNLFNVKFDDLKITDFKKLGTRTDKTYFIIIIILSVRGKMSRTGIVNVLNISFTLSVKIMDQYLEYGYLRCVSTRRKGSINGISRMFQVEELELTSKGYDLLNHIFSILIDESFL